MGVDYYCFGRIKGTNIVLVKQLTMGAEINRDLTQIINLKEALAMVEDFYYEHDEDEITAEGTFFVSPDAKSLAKLFDMLSRFPHAIGRIETDDSAVIINVSDLAVERLTMGCSLNDNYRNI